MLNGSNTRRRLAGVLAAGLALVAWGCGDDGPTSPQEAAEADLGVVRRSTIRYQQESVALRDGYVADAICVGSPAGTMGIHYLNPGRMDDRLVAAEPEILLYIREGGQTRLVAVEYWKPVLQNGQPYFGPTPPANPGPAPQMFGQTFQGPMPGHNPTMPWHYDLHVWIWQDNPAGMFAQFNPGLSCS
jgi:hypothetical protein